MIWSCTGGGCLRTPEILISPLKSRIGDFPPEDAATFEDAAVRLAQMREALEAVGDACGQLGCGRSSGRGQGCVGKAKSPRREVTRASNGGNRALADKIRARNAQSTCHVRGRKGHRAGDPACLSGAIATPLPQSVGDKDHDCDQHAHEAMVVRVLAAALSSGRGVKDAGRGIADIMTVMGDKWWRE